MAKPKKLDRRSFLSGLGAVVAALSIPDLDLNSQAAHAADTAERTGRVGDLDANTLFDVCIIGSGFAGAVLGETLVRHGIKTIMLESGPDPREKSLDPRSYMLDAYRSSGPIDYPVAATRFRGVGGTSWLWGGNCTRLHPLDFEENSYTPGGASWPITYADLDAYYEQAERALRVRGKQQSEYDPPRKTDFPLPSDRDLSPLASLLTKAGIAISDIPFSTPVNHDASMSSGRFGPFLRMTDSHLPDFRRSTKGSLISGATVTRLLVDEAAVLIGAEVRDLDRNVKIVRARVYVVACGGLESPRLLLLSRSPDFREGIGNNHGWVGRCFMEHRPASYSGLIEVGWSSFSLFQLAGITYQFYRTFKKQDMGGTRLGFHLDGVVSKKDLYAGEFGSVMGRFRTRRLKVTIESEMKPSPQNRVTLDKEIKDYFGNPVTNLFLREAEDDVKTIDRAKKIVRKIYTDLGIENVERLPRNLWAHHHMGTCRMGNDSGTSVVDRNLRVHGTKNLFVAGSSVFVTSGASNPTLTLTALSLRLSDHLQSQLQNGAFPAPRKTRHEKL